MKFFMSKLFLCFCLIVVSICPLVAQSQTFGYLDAKAKRTPLREAQTKEDLVRYLTKDLTTDTQKARIVAAWMAYQIQRNGFLRKQRIEASNNNRPAPEPLPNDIFKTRIGSPEQFADLYQELCTLAGLETVVIPGYAGYNIRISRYEEPKYVAFSVMLHYLVGTNYPLQRYLASWNAVRIEGEWKLVDTYWMIDGDIYEAQDIRTERQMRTFLKRREQRIPSVTTLVRGKNIDDDFFFAKPRTFIKTHYPNDSQWQLLPVPQSWSNFISN